MLLLATCPPVLYMPHQTSTVICSQTISSPQVRPRCSLHIEGGSPLHNNPKPWLLVGLGNPGKKYEGTRHNVGFKMIDSIAQAEGISMNAIQSKALIGKGYISNAPVLLAKPQTYMNLSGESVGPLAVYYRVPFHRILLIVDMTDLACGILCLKAKGGHRLHNGVKSVIDHLKGNHDFPRLYVGIGGIPGRMDPKAYVLQQFSPMEHEKVSACLQDGVDAVRLIISKGFSEHTDRFNLKQKYKYHKV